MPVKIKPSTKDYLRDSRGKMTNKWVWKHYTVSNTSTEELKKLYKNVPPNKADIIVALGGDGTILKCLHDYLKKKIPIYGMNRGFVGFLMNQYSGF